MSCLEVFGQAGSPVARARLGAWECAALVGRQGVLLAPLKREGDGCSPAGEWRIVRGFYRPDRGAVPPASADWPWVALRPTMGWCDAPRDALYNQLCEVDYGASHEKMWREDAAYDRVLVLDYNLDGGVTPAGEGRGSAIFLHVWREGATQTEGCVALRADDLDEVLRRGVNRVRIELVA